MIKLLLLSMTLLSAVHLSPQTGVLPEGVSGLRHAERLPISCRRRLEIQDA